MYSFHSVFNTLSLRSLLISTSVLYLPLFLIITLFVACTNSEDFANPLDSDNLRTAGAPPGLELFPGDSQIKVTWTNTGQEGIKAYKVYRRSTSNSEEPFVLIGTVDAPASEFLDTQNIENDRRDSNALPLFYEYRISYIDINGVETPDPVNPPSNTEEPFRLWQTDSASPSVQPPTPVVTIGDPTDLSVGLFWENYEFPQDFAIFRVYVARDKDDGKKLVFLNVAEIERDKFYYIDINFREDGVTKVYRVAAVDEFGVEGITTISATSPNLPPSPPRNFQARYYRRSIANVKYDVILTWEPNQEGDLAGYQIYTKDNEDNLLPRRIMRPKDRTVTIAGEDPLVVNQELFFKTYFITAFDDTPGTDGKRDESELVEAQQ